jgi:hypothetical protein
VAVVGCCPGITMLALLWLTATWAIVGATLMAPAARLRRYNCDITTSAGDRSHPAPA